MVEGREGGMVGGRGGREKEERGVHMQSPLLWLVLHTAVGSPHSGSSERHRQAVAD